jgi:hypothetical protein
MFGRVGAVIVLVAVLGSPLSAQTRGPAFTAGLSATLGESWQLQGVEAGILRPVRLGVFRFVSFTGRVGTFVDEASLVSGTRGFAGGLVVAAESPLVTLFEVGAEQSPTRIAFNLTLETSAYLASNSPFPQGNRWIGLALLPSIRTVQTDNIGFSLLAGPVMFLGNESSVRAQLGIRIEIPTGRPSRPM